MINRPRASSGHKLGQIIGDWFEQYFALPLLSAVAGELDLFLDSRFVSRACRGNKIIWRDADGNIVDYDFVLELGGKTGVVGAPVAFIETFWRRGARHSKDKARDDSGKLLPMHDTYPTARFLGVIASGDFTEPARDVILSRGIDLLYVPKQKILAAFAEVGLTIDYPDSMAEAEKELLSRTLETVFTDDMKRIVAQRLRDMMGAASLDAYTLRVRGRLSALPQEIRLSVRRESNPYIFRTVEEVSDFLARPQFDTPMRRESYNYEITFSDGSEFSRNLGSVEELITLNEQLQVLAQHMSAIAQRGR